MVVLAGTSGFRIIPIEDQPHLRPKQIEEPPLSAFKATFFTDDDAPLGIEQYRVAGLVHEGMAHVGLPDVARGITV